MLTVRNRLVIGIAGLENEPEVRIALSQLGIPQEAVVVEQADEIVFESDYVHSTVRPLLPGTVIGHQGVISSCTMGVVVAVGGSGRVSHLRGLLTAGHCTAGGWGGGVEGTLFYQNQYQTGQLVGMEVEDPTHSFFSGCLNAGFVACRFSDTALLDIPNQALASSSRLGKIARLYRRTTSGPIFFASDLLIVEPAFEFVNSPGWLNVPVGTVVEKIGQASGWTYGAVTGTCKHVSFAGPMAALYCQNTASYHSDGGDSGSPVFVIHGHPEHTSAASFAGIHFASSSASVKWFSPFAGIRNDILGLSLMP